MGVSSLGQHSWHLAGNCGPHSMFFFMTTKILSNILKYARRSKIEKAAAAAAALTNLL
jgi:hypothetical protein